MAEKKKKTSKSKKAATTSTSTQTKKETKQIDDEKVYCICRKGYDGKEFMIACDTCQEWFHGECVGISPKSVDKNYYCESCQAKQKKTNVKITTNGKDRGKKGSTKKSSSKKKASNKANDNNTAIAMNNNNNNNHHINIDSNNKNNNNNSIIIKSSDSINSSILSSTPPPPLPTPPTSQSSSTIINITLSNTQINEDEDDELDDICPICEFECTCGTESSAPVSIPTISYDSQPPQPEIIKSTSDTQQNISTKIRIKRPTPKKPKKKNKNKKSSPKSKVHIKEDSSKHDLYNKNEEEDDEDVDILIDGDDDDDENIINNNSISLIIDPLSSDDGLSSGDLSSVDESQINAASPYSESHLGSYTSSIHIDSDDQQVEEDDDDIEQMEERAIIEEMMEDGSSVNSISDEDDMNNEEIENVHYYNTEEESIGISDDEEEEEDSMDDDSIDEDIDDEEDEMEEDEDEEEEEEEEAHSYYFSTNGLWASSDEEEEEEEEEEQFDYNEIPFHSDTGPLHVESDNGGNKNNELLSNISETNTLFNSIAEAFLQVLAPLANGDNSLSESIISSTSTSASTPITISIPTTIAAVAHTAPTTPITPTAATAATSHRFQQHHHPVLPFLNVANFDLGSNAAAYLNSAPTSPITHRSEEFLRRPSLPSSAVLAAQGQRDMELTSDNFNVLSSMLTSDTLSLSLLQPTSTSLSSTHKENIISESPLSKEMTTEKSIMPISTSSSSSFNLTSSPVISIQPNKCDEHNSQGNDDTKTSIPTATTTSSTPQNDHLKDTISSNAPHTPSKTIKENQQPTYDLASLLPADMKIPEQLLELIKISLAASHNEKSTSSTSSSAANTSSTFIKKGSTSRQLLPKPSSDGLSVLVAGADTSNSSTNNDLDKKRPSSTLISIDNKRRRSSKASGSGSIDDNQSEDINIDDIEEDEQDEKEVINHLKGYGKGKAIEENNGDDDDNGDDEKKEVEEDDDDIVAMDELLDISKLDSKTEDSSLSQEAVDDRFTRDLSRWERVPIGAFRLMRAKNRLWLNR